MIVTVFRSRVKPEAQQEYMQWASGVAMLLLDSQPQNEVLAFASRVDRTDQLEDRARSK